jgi:hypothetical protein
MDCLAFLYRASFVLGALREDRVQLAIAVRSEGAEEPEHVSPGVISVLAGQGQPPGHRGEDVSEVPEGAVRRLWARRVAREDERGIRVPKMSGGYAVNAERCNPRAPPGGQREPVFGEDLLNPV